MASLTPVIYTQGNPLHETDQITVHPDVWEDLERGAASHPVFVTVSGIVYGRICPGPCDEEAVLLPYWMMEKLLLHNIDLGGDVHLSTLTLPPVSRLLLQPETETWAEGREDALADLAEAISGGWACLNQGQELNLGRVGRFTVVDLLDADEDPLCCGRIHDLDVNLELLSRARPPTPIPEPPALLEMPTSMLPPSALPVAGNVLGGVSGRNRLLERFAKDFRKP